MANYSNGPYYTRPMMNDRFGPRFQRPTNRNVQRKNFNDIRPQMSKPNNIQPGPNKPPTEPSTSIPTPPTTTPLPSAQNLTTTPEQSIAPSTEATPTETKQPIKVDSPINIKPSDQQQRVGTVGQKRTYSTEQSNNSTLQKTSQGGRSRLFIGNIPSDLTQDEFQLLFGKYGELIEYYVNPSRAFGFIKLSSKQLAEQAKQDLDGYILRGKPLRIRFASQGAMVKVKNLSANVSNELLKEAFEQYFGSVERAVVIVDDRGKSTGEGIVEFEKKPSAQKCLNECTERCFFITRELKPIIVEPWDSKDDEDGLPEKSLLRNDIYYKERELQPRYAEPNSIEYTIGLKWKNLELQEKQLLEEVKGRIQYASEQTQVEIDQMLLEHQARVLREELTRRQEDLRRIDELRSQDFDRRRNAMPIHRPDPYNNSSINNVYHQNQTAATTQQYNDFQQNAFTNSKPLMQQSTSNAPAIDAAYTTNQATRGYNMQAGSNARPSGNDYNQQQEFDRKRARY